MNSERIAAVRIGGAIIVAALLTLVFNRKGVERDVDATPARSLASAPLADAAGPQATAAASAASALGDTSAARSPSPQSSASRDDSTYDQMLAATQVNPESPRAASDLTKLHETFVLTPDDPAWARPTEQALRKFFQAKAAGSTVEITSVSCRVTRCEVQGQHRVPTFDGAGVVAPTADWEAEQRRIFDVLHEPRPAGESVLRQENLINQLVGERMGFLISYTREDTPP